MSPFPSLPAAQLASLLAAIHEEPESNELRLVLADWLEERGDPRAELIRIQCELVHLPLECSRCRKLSEASRNWIEQYADGWLGPFQGSIRPDPFPHSSYRLQMEIHWDRGLPLVLLPVANPLAGFPETLQRNWELGWFGRVELHVSSDEQAHQLASAWEDAALRQRLQQVTALGLACICTEETLRSLSRLSSLRSLDMGFSQVGDTGLQHLQALPQLRCLTLRGIHGGHLASLSRAGVLARLRILALSCTTLQALSEADCQCLADLSQLAKLSLFGFVPDGPGWRHLAGLKSLRWLSLPCTTIQSQDLAHLAGLSRLEYLSLPGPTWGSWPAIPPLAQPALHGSSSLIPGTVDQPDAGLKYLDGLTGLRHLNLGRTEITGRELQHLAGLFRLETLLLPESPLGPHLGHLRNLTSLHTLFLNRCSITDDDLAALSGLHRLRRLHLVANPIQGPGLAHLGRLFLLEDLKLARTPLQDEGLAHLAPLEHLTDLDLSGTRITDRGLAYLGGLSQLERLWLPDTRITDAGLCHLSGLRSLRFLDLDSVRAITDVGLPSLCALPLLEELFLGGAKADLELAHSLLPSVRIFYKPSYRQPGEE